MRFEYKAAVYDQNAVVQATLAQWMMEWVEPSWPADRRVLEAGAGTGLLTRQLAPRGPMSALDLSPAMVAQGRSRIPEVQWQCGDAWQLAPGSYDRLYSSAVLQWAHNADTAVRNWREALAPGGCMVHGFFIAPTLTELASLAGDCVPLRWRGPEEWVEAFSRAGLKVLRWETRRVVRLYPSALVFWRELHDTGAVSAAPQLGPGRLRQIIRNYDSAYRQADGQVSATWMFMRLEAQR